MRTARLPSLCLWLALLSAGVAVADDAYVYPESVYVGDIVEFVIEYDSRFPALYALDSAPLEPDFEVLDARSRVFRVTENGQQFHRMQWRLQLLPRQSGRLSVPSLGFGDAVSPPLTLEVLPLPEELDAAQHVFLEVQADPIDPYAGQAVQIITRLFYNTPIGRGRIDEPDADDILRFRHGQDHAYREFRSGREYHVLERRMAVIGSTHGKLPLTPAQYRGRILHSSESSAAYAQPGERKINRRSAPIALRLREPPASYSGRYWLPATSLELEQRWAHDLEGLRVGDSVDWTLRIVATGLAAQSLPENLLLTISDPARFRVYPDRAVRSDSFDGQQLTSRLEQKFVIVATEVGSVEVPEIALTWWDVESDRERVSRLAATRFEVAAAAARDSEDPSSAATVAPIASAQAPWRYAAIVAMLVAVGSILAICRDSLKRLIYTPFAAAWCYRRARYRLRRACLADDAQACRARLLEWARLRWPGQTINGLYWLHERAGDPELAGELRRLDAALYSIDFHDWQGKRLWQLLARHSRRERATRIAAEKPALPELYSV